MGILLRCVTLCVIATLTISCSAEKNTRSFQVDYEHDTFLMDGKPFKYISGSVHYFRMPHQYWRDRLRKIKMMGLNAITTYVEWFTHEPRKGVFNFEGDADVEKFIKMAAEEGLYVILRPGPYICAEREFGGFPAWLLTENPEMKFRTYDKTYLHFVDKWFQELFKRMKPFLYGNGGPIIMVQVENEYGAYPTIDTKYLAWLRDQMLSYVEDKALLFTTDQWGKSTVDAGAIPNVFGTVDFGTTDNSMSTMFGNLRAIQPSGPLVNSEFYPGWLSYWGEPMQTVATDKVIKTMKSMLAANVSFSFYMVYGGTNFGFTAGTGSAGSVQKLSLTSYDYDAPISEAGDLTDKYMAIRNLIKQELNYSYGTDKEVEKLRYAPKGDYGSVTLSPKVPLLGSPIGSPHKITTQPHTMEYFGQNYGIIAYSHVVKDAATKSPAVLEADIRDRALVLLDDEPVAVLTYTVNNKTPLPSKWGTGAKLTLVVENEGRRNYYGLYDVTKGIVGNVTVDGATLEGWDTVSYELTPEDVRKIETLPSQNLEEVKYPMFFTSEFKLPSHSSSKHPLDTFLDMRGWGKGIVWVNGHNLGRYWHVGSQQTLYVPGVWLKGYPEVNHITVLELHHTNAKRTLQFITKPIFEFPEPSVQLQ